MKKIVENNAANTRIGKWEIFDRANKKISLFMEWLIVWLTKVYLGWKYSEKNQSMVLLVILSQYSKWFSGDAVLRYVTSNEEKIIVLCTETRTSIINWKCRAQFFVIFQALITLPDAGNLWLCKLDNFTFSGIIGCLADKPISGMKMFWEIASGQMMLLVTYSKWCSVDTVLWYVTSNEDKIIVL